MRSNMRHLRFVAFSLKNLALRVPQQRAVYRLGPLLSVAILLGCSAGPEPKPQSDVAGMAPPSWSTSANSGVVQSGWISEFGDMQLVQLVNQALANNPDLAVSAAHLDLAMASAKKAGAALAPNLDLGVAGDKTSYFGGQTPGSLRQNDVTSFGPSLDLSWELDVWGRIRSEHRGVEEQAQASADDLEAARHSLAAQVAKAWFAAIEAKLQKDLANEFVVNYQKTLDIVQARLTNGAVTQQDLSTAQGDLANAQQNAEANTTAYTEAVRSLEVLLGQYPGGALDVAQTLQAVPPPIPAGLPSEILERRPDVRAAEREVAAAYQFVKEAQAAKLPRIALTSSIGSSSNSLASLVDPKNIAANFAGNLLAPIFDGGARQADLDSATAQQKVAYNKYRKVALVAFQEVENALTQEASLTQRENNLTVASQKYTEAREIAETRYKQGETDLTSVLTVERQELQSRSTLLQVKSERLQERVNLHLALGGDFQ